MKQNSDMKESLSEFEDLLDKVRDVVVHEIDGYAKDSVRYLEEAEKILGDVETCEDVDDIFMEVDKAKDLIDDVLRLLR